MTRLQQARDTTQHDILKKAEFDREFAKLANNSLLGRLNQRIDRPQTLFTKDPNDVACLLGDGQHYSHAAVEPFMAGNQPVIRVKFREGSYQDHIGCFQICPHLTAYMLAYSKCLLQANFQYLAEIGTTLLYTDTDSIVFQGTPEQWELYKARFVPTKKTGGGMVLEGEFVKTRVLGPKKYATMKANGDYEWHCNGVPARSNTHVDMWEIFGQVLHGETVPVNYFNIALRNDYKLCHSTDAEKKLRFICLKGAVEDGGIRWWQNEDEFRDYAATLVPAGLGEGVVGATELQAIEPVVATKQLNYTLQKKPKVKKTEKAYVYVLQRCDDPARSYVGATTNLKRRLNQHNKGTGARSTQGHTWQYFAVYEAPRSFESALHLFSVDSCEEWVEVAQGLIDTNFPRVMRVS
jgi:predicted GIY-YIG superfamily endonuclease